MSLQWIKYSDSIPNDSSRCVVATLVNGKVSAGIFTFHWSGTASYWQDNTRHTIMCKQSDCWCYVDSIINSVAQRLEDEMRDELDRQKNNIY